MHINSYIPGDLFYIVGDTGPHQSMLSSLGAENYDRMEGETEACQTRPGLSPGEAGTVGRAE